MPRSFDVTTETAADVAAVRAAFADRDYWLARLAAYGGEAMSLDRLEVDPAGAVSVQTSQDLTHDVLPGVFARVLPGDLRIVRTEVWQPTEDEVHGDVTIAAHGVPGSGVGAAVLAPRPAGSRLRFSGTLEVRIPLVGGRIEQFIADLIVKEVPEMQRFTTEWIAAHG
ncbi:DUF2505 domain-containing protein [Mycolicibacterium sp.]|uniref:DUF2505 domain-containing protein n=1 Tax=Mycolicibacterium sp. TaxID=2320850 RepID=UPI003D09D700